MRQRKKLLHLSTFLGSIDEKEAVRLKHKGEDGWSFEREFGCLNDKRGAVSTPARTTSEEPIGNSQAGRLTRHLSLSASLPLSFQLISVINKMTSLQFLIFFVAKGKRKDKNPEEMNRLRDQLVGTFKEQMDIRLVRRTYKLMRCRVLE